MDVATQAQIVDKECLGYDTKQSDGEVPVMLELSGMRRTPSLLLLPGPLWPGMVALDRVLSMGQIGRNGILMLNWLFEIELFWQKLYLY